MPPIYLVRHATPDWDRRDIPYHLPPGPPLTAKGEAEADELGQFLRQANVGRIYFSPLERCKRTAQIASAIANVTPQELPGLTEMQPGERSEDIVKRVWPVWEEAIQHSEPAALITHGGPIAVMLERLGLINEALAHYKRLFDRNNPLPPAGVWQAARAAADPAWELSLSFVPEAYRKSLLV